MIKLLDYIKDSMHEHEKSKDNHLLIDASISFIDNEAYVDPEGKNRITFILTKCEVKP